MGLAFRLEERRVDRQADEEVRPALVGIEDRQRRTVPLHRRADLGDARGAALGEFQLLEEVTNPPVAVAPGDDPLARQLLSADRGIGAGVADDLDPVWV